MTLTNPIKYCFCGLPLYVNMMGLPTCTKHGLETFKKEREKVGKYSGKSNRPYGMYEVF